MSTDPKNPPSLPPRPATPAGTPATPQPLRHPAADAFRKGVEVTELGDTQVGELLDLFQPPVA